MGQVMSGLLKSGQWTGQVGTVRVGASQLSTGQVGPFGTGHLE